MFRPTSCGVHRRNARSNTRDEAATEQAVQTSAPRRYGTWAVSWVRGSNGLWVMQRWGIWSYDFSNPAEVKETHIEHAAAADKVPKPILDALHGAVDFSGVNGLLAASALPAK
jgi:hypothetical protein